MIDNFAGHVCCTSSRWSCTALLTTMAGIPACDDRSMACTARSLDLLHILQLLLYGTAVATPPPQSAPPQVTTDPSPRSTANAENLPLPVVALS